MFVFNVAMVRAFTDGARNSETKSFFNQFLIGWKTAFFGKEMGL